MPLSCTYFHTARTHRGQEIKTIIIHKKRSKVSACVRCQLLNTGAWVIQCCFTWRWRDIRLPGRIIYDFSCNKFIQNARGLALAGRSCAFAHASLYARQPMLPPGCNYFYKYIRWTRHSWTIPASMPNTREQYKSNCRWNRRNKPKKAIVYNGNHTERRERNEAAFLH